MTQREQLLSVIRRRPQATVPFYADFTPRLYQACQEYFGPHFKNDFGFFSPQTIEPRRKEDAPVYDFTPWFDDIPQPAGSSISEEGVLSVPSGYEHFTGWVSPLRNEFDEEAIRSFPVWRNPEHFTTDHFKAEIDAIHQNEQVAAIWVGRLFEAAWPIRGHENFLADMIGEPDLANYLLDNEHRWNMFSAEAAVRAGADMLIFGDDVGSQKGLTFSPALWRKLMKPRWAEVFAMAKSLNPDVAIWYHSCGNVVDIIPDFIEIGLDILNPIQPECMDIEWIRKEYGNFISFDGGLGTQQIMPHGSPAEVAAETRRLLDVFGANGGFILSPAHVLEPEVPILNIEAFLTTAKNYTR